MLNLTQMSVGKKKQAPDMYFHGITTTSDDEEKQEKKKEFVAKTES